MRQTPLKRLVRRNAMDTSIEAAKSLLTDERLNVTALELLVLKWRQVIVDGRFRARSRVV
jgi:hypothetical protein